MDDDENYWIPRTFDDPALFFVWEADTAFIFILWTLLGALMGGIGLLFGITIGWLCARGYTTLKEEGGRGLIMKMCFWFLPSSIISEKNPSKIREHLGN